MPWILSGALLGLSAPGFGLWPLAWFGLIPAILLLKQTAHWQEALYKGFWFGAAYHATYLCWFWGLHPLTWMGFNEAQSLLVAFLAWCISWGWGGLLIGLIFAGFRAGFGLPAPVHLLLLPALWVLGFSLYQKTEIGIPWAELQYTQAALPGFRAMAGHLGAIHWGGIGLNGGRTLEFLMVLYNTAGAAWLTQTNTPLPSRKKWLFLSALPLLLLFQPPSTTSDEKPMPIPVALIQGNLPIDVIRNQTASKNAAQTAYLNVLKANNFPQGSLVVLPEEGAVPSSVSLDRPMDTPEIQSLMTVAKQKHIAIITGLATRDSRHGTSYNSMLLIDGMSGGLSETATPVPLRFYHKRQLVPFGEYTPFLDPRWLQSLLLPWGVDYGIGFDRGQSEPVLRIPGAQIGGLVCFEAVYPEFSNTYQGNGANLLVNISNLGWFHGNPWLEEQFLAMAQMRAAENHVAMVLATNSGISALLSPEGEILQKAPSQQAMLLRWPSTTRK